MIIVLIGICIVCILLFIIPLLLTSGSGDTYSADTWFSRLSQIGLFTLFGEMVLVMVLDWRGVITLRGASKGYTFHKGQRVSTTGGFVCLYIFFPYIMLPIYLVRTALEYRRTKYEREHQQRHKVASLEAELGILPAIEGACRVCKKPLVVGADFCQYCGATAVERPKICPACAATASPDAKWCPKCRTALP